jgi:N-formylglutamate amidohydrolase
MDRDPFLHAPGAPPVMVPPIAVNAPARVMAPLVFASPHSGSYYPTDFIAASPLDLATLRRSEDCYIDELFGEAPALGAPLLRALYPRAYIDVNREAYELDPEMFEQPLPHFVNTASARVVAGLGTIARIVASRREIYRRKLSFAEAERRIETVYKPYHQALRALVSRVRRQFGFCILVDCHSMPSSGLPMEHDPFADHGARHVDVVLGDRVGLSCAGILSDTVERFLSGIGYQVLRNNPYAGGFTTQHYGDPANGIHALQVEINRAIYMDEATLARRPRFASLKTDMQALIAHLSHFAAGAAMQLRYQRLSAE